MKRIRTYLMILLIFFSLTYLCNSAKDNCADCHSKLGPAFKEHVILPDYDVHKKAGKSCVDCHGGDSKIDVPLVEYRKAMDPQKGFVGRPPKVTIPALCGKCHSNPKVMRYFNPNFPTDQEDQYKLSQHGQLLAKGDKKVATCINCHNYHGIRPINDPKSPVYPTNLIYTCGNCHSNAEYMKEYNIPTDQVIKYRKSVHAYALYKKGDLSAPVCNDCHGTHGPVQPKPGAIINVCGQCHVNNWQLFIESPHKNAFLELNYPACEICHGNHDIPAPSDKLIGIQPGSICLDCHSDDSPGYKAAAEMRNAIDKLSNAILKAEEKVVKARKAGMEVSEQEFILRDAKQALTESRVLIHAFNANRIINKTKEGTSLADQAYKAGLYALAEMQIRRKGLAASIIIIAIISFALFIKIKKLPHTDIFYTPHDE